MQLKEMLVTIPAPIPMAHHKLVVPQEHCVRCIASPPKEAVFYYLWLIVGLPYHNYR